MVPGKSRSRPLIARSALVRAGLAALLFCGAVRAQGQMPRLLLPTANDALFRGDGEAFYQYVQRDIKGVISYPWEGGQYGFVRDPVETPEGLRLRALP